VSPPSRVSPHTFFYLSDLVYPLFFVNLPTKMFTSGVTPLEGVTRGGPPPPST